MNMSKLSVPAAADRLGVSSARVRQRIDDGSLVAEKFGGRWLVDLEVSDSAPARGRPVSPVSVWYSLLALEQAANLDSSEIRFADSQISSPDLLLKVNELSRASRSRAIHRLKSALASSDDQAIWSWLRNRGARRQYVASEVDLPRILDDVRFEPSGLSHPDSGMRDPRVAEGYVAEADLEQLEQDHWLDRPSIDERPNVVVHVVPARPASINRLILAADLAEYAGPRERQRAQELITEGLGLSS